MKRNNSSSKKRVNKTVESIAEVKETSLVEEQVSEEDTETTQVEEQVA